MYRAARRYTGHHRISGVALNRACARPRIDNVTTPSLLNLPSTPYAGADASVFLLFILLWPAGPLWISCSLLSWVLDLPLQVRAACVPSFARWRLFLLSCVSIAPSYGLISGRAEGGACQGFFR
jgi:hypothetical protein